MALSLYSLFGAWIAATHGNQFAVPFILLYTFAFGYVSLQGLWDARPDWRRPLDDHLATRLKTKRLGVKRSKVQTLNVHR